MHNVFFDCEFTHLWLRQSGEEAQLVSIGCASEDGKTFYAENADVQLELCSDFTLEVVLPLLEGGDARMPHVDIARSLKAWVEGFDDEVKFWSDAPGYDWPHVVDLFATTGIPWPANLAKRAVPLAFRHESKTRRCLQIAEDMLSQPHMRRHHALDDALANRAGWLAA